LTWEADLAPALDPAPEIVQVLATAQQLEIDPVPEIDPAPEIDQGAVSDRTWGVVLARGVLGLEAIAQVETT
ncbi:MAG: hypothetical protein ACR2NZ_09385, partial [Rubripirellula sp.]